MVLSQLGSLDWNSVDRDTLAKAAPGVELFTLSSGTARGFEAIAEAIARCCDACGVCGGVSLGTGSPTQVYGAEFYVCPRAPEDARAALRELATSAASPAVRAFRSDDGSSEVYSWTAHGAYFSLRTREFDTGNGTMGSLQLGRCRPEDTADTWALDDGTTLVVRRVDIRTDDGTRSLWFEYLTTCLGGDSTCTNRELDALWPRLRAVAEHERVSQVTIDAALCTSETRSFSIDRDPDGSWTGGFRSWRPKSP